MSFTVFARARPIRTAFLLIETAGFDAVCDGLVRWGNDYWGGRRSIVGLLEKDGTIDSDVWQELVRFDPDRVHLLASVSEELLRQHGFRCVRGLLSLLFYPFPQLSSFLSAPETHRRALFETAKRVASRLRLDALSKT